MTVTPDTVVVGVERDISFTRFHNILVQGNSPAAPYSLYGYDKIVTSKVSPAFDLAIFKHESRFGTVGIVPANGLRNPGATRSIRAGNGRVIQVPGRGPFVKYDSWADGWLDLAYRLVDPTYVYAQEGRTTIRQIIERWAPADDGNAPDSYVNAVVRSMNEWIEEPPMAGDDSRFEWVPDTSEFGYPKGTRGRGDESIDLIIIHITAGVDSLPWLNGNNGSSAHYLTWQDFTPRAQMIAEADAAWTAGNGIYNRRSLNIEFEIRANTPITDEQLREAAETVRPIAERNNIPLIYIGRDNGPGQRGIIGHADVPDPNNPGKWGGDGNHTDPGKHWDWGKFIDYLNAPDSGERRFDESLYPIRGSIRARWEELEGMNLSLPVFGYPVSPEYEAIKDQKIVVRQKFERCVMEYDKDAVSPWDVTCQFISDIVGDIAPDCNSMRFATVAHIKQQRDALDLLEKAIP